jgi:pimeloyl-ACP methyl ester carboxylesterase
LTDSPYFLTAIADFFFRRLGFNVYLPLLQGHGLRNPETMENVSLEEWKTNVTYAIEVAAGQTVDVSIGGLSAGGALSFYMGALNPLVTGDLYLFSAALDISGGAGGIAGEMKERLLRTQLARLLADREKELPLIGPHPYRYGRMDKYAAIELGKLILETDRIMAAYSPGQPFPKRIFAAHSACDQRADLAGIDALQRISDPKMFTLFLIPESANVPHASVVLKDPIVSHAPGANQTPLERANPHFDEMMRALATFAAA